MLQHFEPLAEQGRVVPQLLLGIMYESGDGVAQDHVESLRWYRRAADQGYSGAQLKVDLMYSISQGVAQNRAEALLWFQARSRAGRC